MEGTDFALSAGVLVITEQCVFLDDDGDFVLLIWPDVRTAWDSERGIITFRRLDGTQVELGHGDHVTLGGGGSRLAEGSSSATDWAESINWVAAPRPECLVDSRWVVGEVVEP